MATVGIIDLATWTGIVPVLLPWGEPTLSTINVASAGVSVPFSLYIIAMFMIIVPVWMQNFASDKQRSAVQFDREGTVLQHQPQFMTAVGLEEVTTDFPRLSEMSASFLANQPYGSRLG